MMGVARGLQEMGSRGYAGVARGSLRSQVLTLQIVAVGGAYLAAAVSKRYGNKTGLYFQLVIWFCICLAGYFVEGKSTFYVVAAAVGLSWGAFKA